MFNILAQAAENSDGWVECIKAQVRFSQNGCSCSWLTVTLVLAFVLIKSKLKKK